MADQHDPTGTPPADDAEETDDESLVDEVRGTGVGLEDPNIVGDETPEVDAQVASDEPPQV